MKIDVAGDKCRPTSHWRSQENKWSSQALLEVHSQLVKVSWKHTKSNSTKRNCPYCWSSSSLIFFLNLHFWYCCVTIHPLLPSLSMPCVLGCTLSFRYVDLLNHSFSEGSWCVCVTSMWLETRHAFRKAHAGPEWAM